MALPINIDDLLSKQKVESNRIEFKAGWNPSSIYHSICAFANDIDNLGGGYILVGVEEENGVAVRPVKGLEENQLDKIQREMLQFNAMMDPIYYPRISVEEIDERKILVIWVTSGHNRPYTAPADVTAKLKKPVFYIRYGTSSIEAKGENLDRLRDMANRVPYDDRGNENIGVDDISPLLVKAHLASIGSKLAKADFTSDMEKILEQMELLDGPERPEKFFPVTRVEIVVFPEGRENNPDNFIEIPKITGPVPMMIRDTLNYLRTNIVKERIIKPTDNEKSIKVYNYPFQSLEEAVVNALYHRDYKEREPVEITIEPDKISILSYSGPDRS
uniref:AlbA family DNA-binding domain-containing protein n=1 Tax=Candidatus Limisoma sp. TaxID=3076476 RepID=UPI004028A2CE